MASLVPIHFQPETSDLFNPPSPRVSAWQTTRLNPSTLPWELTQNVLAALDKPLYGSKPEHIPAFITDYYDWASLGHVKVVHVGGGPGQIATALVKRHANLNLIVQDQEFMMGPKEAGLPQ